MVPVVHHMEFLVLGGPGTFFLAERDFVFFCRWSACVFSSALCFCFSLSALFLLCLSCGRCVLFFYCLRAFLDWRGFLFDGQWCRKNMYRQKQTNHRACAKKNRRTRNKNRRTRLSVITRNNGQRCCKNMYRQEQALCTGSVYWLCVLALCSGSLNCSVYWLCELAL